MSSFPVPVSPSMRTVESVEATCSAWPRTNSRAALLPMIRMHIRSGGSASGYVTGSYSGTRNLLSHDAIVVALTLTDQFSQSIRGELHRLSATDAPLTLTKAVSCVRPESATNENHKARQNSS